MGDQSEISRFDIRPLARACQRLFSATQWLFPFAVIGLLGIGVEAQGERDAELFSTDPREAALHAVFILALLFYAALFAIMGYRRRYWRGALFASAFMGLVLAAMFVLLATDPKDAGAPSAERWAGLLGAGLVLALPLYWFVRQALGARFLLSADFRGRPAGVAEAMERAEAAFRAQRRSGHGARSWRQRLGGAMTVIGFIGVIVVIWAFLALALIPEEDPGSDLAGSVGVVGFFLLPLFALSLSYGRRLSQPEAARLLEADERAPILLLRAFADDKAALSSTNSFRRFLYLGFYGKIRLEEAIADELARLGPFIAIGEPGERLPDLGAARAYFTQEEWQTEMQGWMARARLIVMIAGATQSLRWELDQIVSGDRLDRLLLLLPPSLKAEERATRWAMIREATAGARWASALARKEIEHAIALFEDRNGVLQVLVSDRPRQADYEIAVRLLASEQFAPQEA